ncbi:hypothetical protein C0Z16_07070 [Paraburkholderia rhynchosiae]|uniref:Uncharacterized protein n=1 Tax=Paraburkholderia rhynchosiae TaxID=487049 RepID=A0ABX4VA19_9BURK|nr:hypothetical protein C0Z16_07070 [Paraburkholderia rhynchosiae]
MVRASATAPDVDAVGRLSRGTRWVDNFAVSARISPRGGVECGRVTASGLPPAATGVAVRRDGRARPPKGSSDSRRRFGSCVVAAWGGVVAVLLLVGAGVPAGFDEIRVIAGRFV